MPADRCRDRVEVVSLGDQVHVVAGAQPQREVNRMTDEGRPAVPYLVATGNTVVQHFVGEPRWPVVDCNGCPWSYRGSSVPRACHYSVQPGVDRREPVRTKMPVQGLLGGSEWVHRHMVDLAGGQVVAGSNPVSPTHCRSKTVSEKSGAVFFVCMPRDCHHPGCDGERSRCGQMLSCGSGCAVDECEREDGHDYIGGSCRWCGQPFGELRLVSGP